jgi:hypothetical protein
VYKGLPDRFYQKVIRLKSVMADVVDIVYNKIMAKCKQDGECHVWNGGDRLRIKYKGVEYSATSAVLKKHQPDVEFDGRVLHTVVKTCGNRLCCWHEHFVVTSKKFTREMLWENLKNSAVRNEEGCLLFQGPLDVHGYGVTTLENETMSTHRASYIINVDEVPTGLVVRHGCRNRNCFEPSHLKVGTYVENSADKKRDGTDRAGSKNVNTIIKEEQAKQIIASKFPRGHPEYKTRRERSEKYNVPLSIVASIDKGETWTHLHGDTSKRDAKNARDRARREQNKTKVPNWVAIKVQRVRSTLGPPMQGATDPSALMGRPI